MYLGVQGQQTACRLPAPTCNSCGTQTTLAIPATPVLVDPVLAPPRSWHHRSPLHAATSPSAPTSVPGTRHRDCPLCLVAGRSVPGSPDWDPPAFSTSRSSATSDPWCCSCPVEH